MRPSLAIQTLRTLAGALFVVAATASSTQAQTIPQRLAFLETHIVQLQDRVGRLTEDLRGQNATINQLVTLVNSQRALINTLQATLGCVSKTGSEVYFTGCNVHIVSGSGATDGEINGLGNLIIGYDEPAPVGFPQSRKRGSHNLVVGPGHWYSSYGGFVAGSMNSVTAPNASVSGGRNNLAGRSYSSVSGGESTVAEGGSGSLVEVFGVVSRK